MSGNQDKSKPKGGRPPKFSEPSRPVTLTLPESTLEGLRLIDPDPAMGIVKLVGSALGTSRSASQLVTILELVHGQSLIIVAASRALARIPFLHMVETSPGRFLLALHSGHDFKSLELAIRDELDELPPEEGRERALLSNLLEIIANTRKENRVSVAEIILVERPLQPS